MAVSGVEGVIKSKGAELMNFEIDNKKIEIFYCESNKSLVYPLKISDFASEVRPYNEAENKKVPVIILNTYSGEGNEVWEECQRLNTKEFILVAISRLNWNDDMTPWECPPLYKGDNYCKGYADNYLALMEKEIIPKVQDFIKNEFQKKIEYFGIAGYSLGGLFALYSGYKTDIFKRIVSASGSMWYPNFAEYVKNNEISKNIDKIYFSLGNKEKFSKIEILKTVEDKTKEIYDYLSYNINTIYEENQGNHFQDGILRMAKGIKWILE